MLDAVFLLVRNLLLARLLSLEDYGLATTFALAVTLVEMVSQFGLQQQMIQSKEGDDARLQASFHGFQVLRGGINGAVLFLCAGPIAGYFGAPEAEWAFQLVALVPVISGFQHFDMHRLSRQMRFWPLALSSNLPSLLSLLSVMPFYWAFGDYRVLLFAILVQMSTILVMTHVVAQRPYALAFDLAVIGRSLRFGWPLLVNGALMFAVFNGERIIIGGQLGLETLALFSLALSLALSPTLVISKSVMSFFLPQLSGAIGTPPYRDLAMTTFQMHLLLGGIMVVAIALLGGPFIHAVLGVKYEGSIALLIWLGVMQALRVYKGGCSVVAMAAAHTENAMVANIIRVSLLPLAWVVVAQGGSLLDLIVIGLVGEGLGLMIGLALALWRQSLPLRPLVPALAVSLALLALACVHAFLHTDWRPDLRTGGGLVFLLALLPLTMPELRGYLRNRVMVGHTD
jgi:O-antigen/teichoic acid export membrane protein